MKNFKFVCLFIFVIIFTTSSCLDGLLNTSDDGTSDGPVVTNPGDLPGQLLIKNESYPMSINGNGEGYGNSYFFEAGNGEHTISISNLTTDVDLELYDWNPSLTPEEIVDEGNDIAIGGEVGLEPETISISTLTSGKIYLIYISEWDGNDGTFDILISNP